MPFICIAQITPHPFSQLNETGDDFAVVDGKAVPELTPLIDTWRFFEREYKAGTLRSIGISNFNEKQIEELCEKAEVKPQNLQVSIISRHTQISWHYKHRALLAPLVSGQDHEKEQARPDGTTKLPFQIPFTIPQH